MAGEARNVSLVIFVLLSILLYMVVALDHEGFCTTPDGENGTCLRIRDCPSVVSFLQERPVPQSTIEFLRKSQCRTMGKDPTVCCPSSNNTLELEPSVLKAPSEGETVDGRPQSNMGLLNLDICSNAYNSRIIEGMDVKLYELPQMTLLGYSVERGSPSECSGVIISERFITTAAHCVTKIQSIVNRTERNYETRQGGKDPDQMQHDGTVREEMVQGSPATKEKKSTVQEEILQILKTIKEPLQLREVDEDTSFLLSFTQNMKNMSPAQKIDFKIAVLNALKRTIFPSTSMPTFDESLNPIYPKIFGSSFPRQSSLFP